MLYSFRISRFDSCASRPPEPEQVGIRALMGCSIWKWRVGIYGVFVNGAIINYLTFFTENLTYDLHVLSLSFDRHCIHSPVSTEYG